MPAKKTSHPSPHADRHAKFVEEYLIDRNATQAAIRAGYSPRTARSQGSDLLTHPDIKAAISRGREKISEDLEMTTKDIARHLANIITADPNELIEFRRVCCRHCWGIDFGWQRTPEEMRQARADHARKVEAVGKVSGAAPLPEFDEAGGVGYDGTRAPNPECPECHGEGSEKPFPKDTRNMSPAARALYAGVKITAAGGLEIKMHSKEKALEMYGRHLGMFKDKLEVDVTPGLADAMRQARERATKR